MVSTPVFPTRPQTAQKKLFVLVGTVLTKLEFHGPSQYAHAQQEKDDTFSSSGLRFLALAKRMGSLMREWGIITMNRPPTDPTCMDFIRATLGTITQRVGRRQGYQILDILNTKSCLRNIDTKYWLFRNRSTLITWPLARKLLLLLNALRSYVCLKVKVQRGGGSTIFA